MHGEDFSIVLFPGLNGEVIETDIEELDRAVAGGYYDLVFMRFGPGEVVEGVLGVEPSWAVSFVLSTKSGGYRGCRGPGCTISPQPLLWV